MMKNQDKSNEVFVALQDENSELESRVPIVKNKKKLYYVIGLGVVILALFLTLVIVIFNQKIENIGTTASPVNSTNMNIKAPLEIADWETCLSPETDVCTSLSFGCCVAPADVLTNKFTCRPLNDPSQCSSTPPTLKIADWETCLSPETDECSSSSFGCCVAPADVLTNKFTCRPKNVASQCSSTPSTLKIADWETCLSPETDVCSSSSFGCCVAPADVLTNKFTCRPKNVPSQCYSPPPSSAISDWGTCSDPATDVCSSPSFGCCVAPADVLTSKFTCRPLNDPSQCYSTLPILEIGDWGTCLNPDTDVCSSPSFGCCVAPSDVITNKFTCRPKNVPSQCYSPPSLEISDWGTCLSPETDVCTSSSFGCCVAPADVLTNKFTCRPLNDPSQCSSTPPTLKIADWETCLSPETDVCSSSSFGCCVAPSDVLTNKFTCRPKNVASQCYSPPPSLEISDWGTCLDPTTDVCSSPSFGCCVAPADVLTNKFTCRPLNDPSQCIAAQLTIPNGGVCLNPATDICSTSTFSCCVAPADVSTNTFRCNLCSSS